MSLEKLSWDELYHEITELLGIIQIYLFFRNNNCRHNADGGSSKGILRNQAIFRNKYKCFSVLTFALYPPITGEAVKASPFLFNMCS